MRMFCAVRARGAVGRRNYHWLVSLRLIVGPANADKVELLLDRYVAALDCDPYLIVPGRPDVDRVERELDAWHGEPVFAYGFEDLTGAQWALLEALAGRAEVCVSLPYEPGRVAFESLQRTADDLARLAQGRVEELPPAQAARAHAPP